MTEPMNCQEEVDIDVDVDALSALSGPSAPAGPSIPAVDKPTRKKRIHTSKSSGTRLRRPVPNGSAILAQLTADDILEAVKKMSDMDQRVFLGQLFETIPDVLPKAFPTTRTESIYGSIRPETIRGLVGIDPDPFRAVIAVTRGKSIRYSTAPIQTIDPRLASWILSDVAIKILSGTRGTLTAQTVQEFATPAAAVRSSITASMLAMNPAAGHLSGNPFTTCHENDAQRRPEIYSHRKMIAVVSQHAYDPDAKLAFSAPISTSNPNDVQGGSIQSHTGTSAADSELTAGTRSAAGGSGSGSVLASGKTTSDAPTITPAARAKMYLESTTTNPFVYSSHGSVTKRPIHGNADASGAIKKLVDSLGLDKPVSTVIATTSMPVSTAAKSKSKSKRKIGNVLNQDPVPSLTIGTSAVSMSAPAPTPVEILKRRRRAAIYI